MLIAGRIADEQLLLDAGFSHVACINPPNLPLEIALQPATAKENIRKSINSQMLTVFLIPILFACVHLAVVLPVVHKLLLLFGHNNIPLLLASAGICVLFFGLIYAFVYKLTSNAYYKIVS